MTIMLYNNFLKETNSTLRPDQPGTEIEGQLVTPFSLSEMTIKFKFTNDGSPQTVPTYNYAFIPDFRNRYYFINDWTFSDGLWYGKFEEDVLATWRTSIGNDSEFVLRATQDVNHNLVDDRCKALAIKNLVKKSFSTRETSVTGVTGCNWYAIDARDSDRVRRYNVIVKLAVDEFTIGSLDLDTSGIILLRTTLDNFYEIYRRILNAAGANYVSQVILGAYYCPIVPVDYASSSIVKKVKLNIRHGITEILEPTVNFPTDRNCYLIGQSDSTLTVQLQADVPVRSSEYGRESWMYGPQGRSLFIVGQPFGKVPIDSDLFDADIKYIGIKLVLDYVTGMTKVFMSPRKTSYQDIAGKNDIYLQTVNFYAQIPVSASGVEDAVGNKLRVGLAAVGMVSSMVGTGFAGYKFARSLKPQTAEEQGYFSALQFAYGKDSATRDFAKYKMLNDDTSAAINRQVLGSRAQSIASNASSLLSAERNSYAQQLNCGDLTMGNQIIELYVEESIFAEPNRSSFGAPVYADKVIKNIPGYIQCESPTYAIASGMTMRENEAIREFMAQGFYYE